MSSRPAPADRAARSCLIAAFWGPLAVCTWLALSPSPPEPVFRISDIVLHAFAFGYLTFALGLAYPGLRMLTLLACMLGYGVAIEVAQSFEAARSAELKDLAVDVAGIVLGLAVLRVFGDWSRRSVHVLLRYWGGA